MNKVENKSINYDDLKKELTALSFADLKEKFNELGITDAWKGGVKKEVLINAGIEVLKQKQENPVTEKPIEKKEDVIGFQFPEGETILEQEHFELVPGLVETGFVIGDTLISEAGKPLSKKISPEDAEKLLEDERLQKVIDRAKELGIETDGLEEDDLYEAILDAEALLQPDLTKESSEEEELKPELEIEVEDAEVVEIEVIDETLFTIEEILENIEITQANLHQALPATRNFLLKKADALEAALSRKRE